MALALSVVAAGRLLETIAPRRDHRAAVAASALIVWAGTPLAFYTYLAPAFAHACSAFVVALFLPAWLCVRRRWTARGLVVLGVLAALMAMVREQDIFFVVGPSIDFALSVADALRQNHRRVFTSGAESEAGTSCPRLLLYLCAGCLAFATTFLPQAVAYLVLNGRIGPSRLVARKMSWTSPHAVQVILSPEHGVLFWTPVVAVALAGLVVLWLRGRGTPASRVIVCLLAMVAAQIYIAGCLESWTVAGAFGQRRFVGLTVLLVIGLAESSSEPGRAGPGSSSLPCWSRAFGGTSR